jgi:deoxyribonuclease IV
MFGSHLSIAGSLSNALREAESLGMDTVQVFTKNQQQWKAPPLADEIVREWKSEVARLGWQGRIAAHASYLTNLASPSDDLWRKSIDLMRVEIERCEALEIPFLVHHPGSPGESGPDSGIGRIAAAYEELFQSTRGYRTACCLENTVGAGTMLGARFEQLAELHRRILDAAGSTASSGPGLEARVGFCFDTCHAHAAGYDMSSRVTAAAALEEFHAHCGLHRLLVVHLNDSKGKLASRLDRHEHIGKGTIGDVPGGLAASGFADLLARPELASIPKILETPKGKTEAGTPYDSLNLRRLRKLTTSLVPIMTSKPRKQTASTRRGHITSP